MRICLIVSGLKRDITFVRTFTTVTCVTVVVMACLIMSLPNALMFKALCRVVTL